MSLAELYNRNAGYWDSTLYRSAYHGAYVRLLKRFSNGRIIGHLQRVLDCGVGAGLLAESLINSGERPLALYGVDLSSSLLGMARWKLRSLGIDARLAFADVTNLPYRDGAMDLVMSALVLEHVPDPQLAMREMVRVLGHARPLILVATRSGAPDHYFRWKYGYRPYPASCILRWMTDSGLERVRPYELTGIARLFARAYVGVKA